LRRDSVGKLGKKLKTHRGAAKRFRKTATGKLKRSHAYAKHILTKKSRHRKRSLKKSALVSKADASFVAPLLPYL
jgi:large subunit ribosomal protein L35